MIFSILKISESFEASFDTKGLRPGNYSATANMDFDGMKKTDSDNFRIGNLNVKVVDYTKELDNSGIKRFDVTVESEWNDPDSKFLQSYQRINQYYHSRSHSILLQERFA